MEKFYKDYYIAYLMADKKAREKARTKWIENLKENIRLCYDDSVLHSLKMVATIATADEYIRTHIQDV